MITVPTELVTRATAELDEQVRRELEIADPAEYIAVAILNNVDNEESNDGEQV